MNAMGLGEWVELLREKAAGMPSLMGVGDGMAGLVLALSSLQPYLHFRRGRYTRNLVYRDARMEVLLNCWDAGTFSPIHDHDGQECWFSVQAGAFVMENFPLEAGGMEPGPARLGAPVIVGPVGAGYVDRRCPEAPIHRVTAAGGPAISLHVYAGPVNRCLVFDTRRHRCVSRELRYHSMFGRPLTQLPDAPPPAPL